MYDLHQGEVPSAPEVRVARERAFDVARRIARDTVERGLLEGDPNLIAHGISDWVGDQEQPAKPELQSSQLALGLLALLGLRGGHHLDR